MISQPSSGARFIRSIKLEVDAFVGEELVVEVMFDFVHVGGDVDERQQLIGKIAAGQAKAGPGQSLYDQLLQLLFAEQAVMHGVVNLVANN